MAPLPGRSLAELLQEQQEPFLLDVYLLENGYSGRILCSEAVTVCWPGGACRRLASHGFRGRAEGIVRSLLAVFSYRRAPKASNCGRKALKDGGEPSTFRRKTRSNVGEDAEELGKRKVDAERTKGWECTEEAKQLSPVSVFELQSDDGSPAQDHIKGEEQPSTSGLHLPVAVLQVFRKLHVSASSKYLRTEKVSHGKKQPLLGCSEEGEQEERNHQREPLHQHHHESLGTHKTGKRRRGQFIAWRRRAGGAIIAIDLAGSDVSNFRNWNLFDPDHATEIGALVGDAILDELLQDFISHI